MPTESFNHRKPANAQTEGVVLVSQAWGTRVHGVDRVGSAGTTVVPAGLYSTAPYVDPNGKTHVNPLIVSTPKPEKKVAICSATRANGTPCTAKAREDGLCMSHGDMVKRHAAKEAVERIDLEAE